MTLLTLSKKRMKNVSVFLKDNSDEEEEEESDKDNEATTEQIMGRGKRTAVLDSKLRVCFRIVFNIVKHLDVFLRQSQLIVQFSPNILI